MKLKLLAVAIALAASTQASASILVPQTDGSGEAMFAIWDTATNTSYVQDLGVTYGELFSNLSNASYSLSYAIDAAVYNDAFSGSDPANLQWNVAASSLLLADFSNFTTTYGLLGTTNNLVQWNYAAFEQSIDIVQQLATAQNGLDPDGTTNPASNLAYSGTIANGGYAGDGGLWSFNYGGNPGNNTAGVGDELNFWLYSTDENGDIYNTQAAGNWAFDGTTLTYGSVSAVPVPAAIWLMGSGLIGLVGVARRKNAAV